MLVTPSPPPPRKRTRVEREGKKSVVLVGNNEISIYSWNVNGIDPLLQSTIHDYWNLSHETTKTSPHSPIRGFLRRHDWPTVCCLQEVKIRPGDNTKLRAVQRAVSNAADLASPDYEAYFCLPRANRFAKISAGKHYGVCTLVRKDLAQSSLDRVREVQWDDEGRVLIVETKATQDTPKLAMFNVYLVNGTELPYRHPETGEITGTRHDRKLEVHKLLQAECRDLEVQGFGIVIAGDINIARSVLDGFPRLRDRPYQHVLNRADFEHRFFGLDSNLSQQDHQTESLEMLDTFRTLHPDERGYSYFSRAATFGSSCDRVDMILVSRSIITRCTAAGMHQTLAERSTSDHVPIFAKFCFDLEVEAAKS